MWQEMEADEAIQQAVEDELRQDGDLNSTSIGVAVDGGVVTLTGTVDSPAMKVAAQRAAHRVAAVRAVANDIRVELPFEHERDDTDIARAVVNAFDWEEQVPEERIQVTVTDGWVVLEGDVDDPVEREAAETVVRNLAGVKGVVNQISLPPSTVCPL